MLHLAKEVMESTESYLHNVFSFFLFTLYLARMAGSCLKERITSIMLDLQISAAEPNISRDKISTNDRYIGRAYVELPCINRKERRYEKGKKRRDEEMKKRM